MKKSYILAAITAITLLSPLKASAHCPLCTGGAGAAAVVAAYFGVKYGSLGVFLGGFTIALALWMAHKPTKRFVRNQETVLFWFIYLSTIIPFYYMFKGDYTSWLVSAGGDYGTWTNRTYLINMFIVGSVLGTLIVYFSPRLSSWISQMRGGRHIKFQGLILTFCLLLVTSFLMQVLPR